MLTKRMIKGDDRDMGVVAALFVAGVACASAHSSARRQVTPLSA